MLKRKSIFLALCIFFVMVIAKGTQKTDAYAETSSSFMAEWHDYDCYTPSPEQIRFSVDIDRYYGDSEVTPAGIEIYRTTDGKKQYKQKVLKLSKKEKQKYQKGRSITKKFTDKKIVPGTTYYYQVKPYTIIKKKKIYGVPTDYLKRSAILPKGDYMVKAELSSSKDSLDISLTGGSKGNAELDFIENQFYGLADLLCQKKDGSYDAVSLSLRTYQYDKKDQTDFNGQDLKLKGKQNITLRFSPNQKGEKIPDSFRNYQNVEILLQVRYEEYYRNLHMNLKTGKACISEMSDEKKISYDTETFTLLKQKKNKKAKKTAKADLTRFLSRTRLPDDEDDEVYNAWCDYGHGITITYNNEDVSKKLVPDGARLYRSKDNKNFQPVADLTYQKGLNYIKYQDSQVKLGEVWYYKARNYVNTKNGKKFSPQTKDSMPFYANFKYNRYSLSPISVPDCEISADELCSPMIFRLQGLSAGNQELKLDAVSCAWACVKIKNCKRWGKPEYRDTITAYSYDGINWTKWKKGKTVTILPKQTIYLKLKIKKSEIHKEYLQKKMSIRSIEIFMLNKNTPDGGQLFQCVF